MHVVLACDFFLKYTAAQATALADGGAEVTLLIRDHSVEFGDDDGERRDALQRARDAGVVVLEAPGRITDAAAVPALLRTRRTIRRSRPQILHVQDKADPRAIAMLPRGPAVLTVHDPVRHPGQPVAPLRKRWLIEGSRAYWRQRARVIVVHSDRLRDEIRLARRQRCVVIPHGLDLRDEPLALPPVQTVGFFGRLEPYKGLDVLARAMPRVWQSRPDARLSVAGTGSMTFPLEDPRVDFRHEYLRETEVETFFRGISLAALPYTEASQTGAGSISVGYGVPVIASNVGGLPDLTLDDTYVFRSGDDAGLAAAIVRHLDDDAAVRGRVLAEIARPKSWVAVAGQMLELYGQVLAGA